MFPDTQPGQPGTRIGLGIVKQAGAATSSKRHQTPIGLLAVPAAFLLNGGTEPIERRSTAAKLPADTFVRSPKRFARLRKRQHCRDLRMRTLAPNLHPVSTSSLFSVGIFVLFEDEEDSHPQMAQITTAVFMSSTHLLNLRNLRMVLDDRLSGRTDGVGRCGLQIDSHPVRMPFPEVSCPASLNLSPTERSEEPRFCFHGQSVAASFPRNCFSP